MQLPIQISLTLKIASIHSLIEISLIKQMHFLSCIYNHKELMMTLCDSFINKLTSLSCVLLAG